MRTKSIEEATKFLVSLPAHVTVLEYQPGNGTRYVLQITYLAGDPSLDNVGLNDMYTVALLTSGCGACMTVRAGGGYLSPGYVGEKLKLGFHEARVLAEIIAKHTDRPADDASKPVD